MNTNSPQNLTVKKEKGSAKTLVIIVIIVLLGVNALLLWQFFDKKSNLDSTQKALVLATDERDDLQTELDDLKNEYDRVNADNATLQSQLSERDEEIKSKVAEIQKMIQSGDAVQLKKARAELTKLKELNKMYITQIDSLNTVAQQLSKENVVLTADLSQEKSRSQNLTDENVMLANKVAIGSVLKTSNIDISGVRYRSSGKEVSTNRANNTEKIKTCFSLLENLVIDSGPKDIYVRILGPDGAILSTSTETFMFKGQPSIYTTKETIDYDNEKTDMCVYWTKGTNYAKGNYTIEIYADGNQIGKSNLTLK
jgi:flagellar basal body-associated protein FliL